MIEMKPLQHLLAEFEGWPDSELVQLCLAPTPGEHDGEPVIASALGRLRRLCASDANTRQNISDVLIEALEPFAEAWGEAQQWKDFDGQDCRPQYLINAVDTGDFERAADALRQAKGGSDAS